jgi:DNA-binding transcriptional regulator YiaG
MSTLAAVLKGEIRRLAKKEARAEVASVRSASGQYRHDIAALKRTNRELARKVALLEKTSVRPPTAPSAESGTEVRFSPKWVSNHRKSIGLSQDSYASLVGVSPMTIFNWEKGKTRPQAKQLAAWGAVKRLGKRAAMQRLEALKMIGARKTRPHRRRRAKIRHR